MAKYILGDIFIGDYPLSQLYDANPQSYPMFTDPGHEGVDWATPNDTKIVAPFNGIVLRDSIADKDYGNFLVIWDPSQLCAVWFCHLKGTPVDVGDKVFQGQVVAYSNNTGRSTGPHLHVNFVETDAFGNRLNLDNGKQGFLNILDQNLVEWKLGEITENMPPYLKQLLEERQLDLTNEPKIRDFFDRGDKAPALKVDLDNARKEIQDLKDSVGMAMSANKQQAVIIDDLTKKVADLKKDSNELLKKIENLTNSVPESLKTPPNSSSNEGDGVLARLVEYIVRVVQRVWPQKSQ